MRSLRELFGGKKKAPVEKVEKKPKRLDLHEIIHEADKTCPEFLVNGSAKNVAIVSHGSQIYVLKGSERLQENKPEPGMTYEGKSLGVLKLIRPESMLNGKNGDANKTSYGKLEDKSIHSTESEPTYGKLTEVEEIREILLKRFDKFKDIPKTYSKKSKPKKTSIYKKESTKTEKKPSRSKKLEQKKAPVYRPKNKNLRELLKELNELPLIHKTIRQYNKDHKRKVERFPTPGRGKTFSYDTGRRVNHLYGLSKEKKEYIRGEYLGGRKIFAFLVPSSEEYRKNGVVQAIPVRKKTKAR